jgi:hypothetical protein
LRKKKVQVSRNPEREGMGWADTWEGAVKAGLQQVRVSPSIEGTTRIASVLE